MTNNNRTKPDVNLMAAARFLRLLDPDAKQWTFQCYDDRANQDKKLARVLHGTLDQHADTLADLNQRGAAVSVTMNETDLKGTKKSSILRVRALCADLDDAPLDPVHECRLRSHVIVETSPDRYHVYWLVDGIPNEDFRDIRLAVAKAFGGDPAVALLTHRARLPGFYHMKGDPFLVRAKSNGGHDAFDYDAVCAEFPPLAVPHKQSSSRIILPADAPVECAKQFVQSRFFEADTPCIHYHRGVYYVWRTSHYRAREGDFLRAEVYSFLHKALARNKEGEIAPFNATPNKVSSVLDALKSGVFLDRDKAAPCWLKGAATEPDRLIACKNGLLDIETRELLPHSPMFFNVNALPFEYDPDAPKPERWMQFLQELWPEDKEARRTLAEIFGLMLTADTSYHKIFLMVGPRRSGKGTIAHVLTALLGRSNVCSPTMASLGTQFGLWPLIDKRAAIVPDARLAGGSDSRKSVEHLLSVSGEDTLTVDRKFAEHWTGKLTARFLILSNELPRFTDASGALASRFVILTTTASFYGQEQLDLRDELQPELPGILNWALKGLSRLRERGYFLMPKSSEDALRQMEDLASPVSAFVRERCVVGANRRIEKADLYEEWKAFCELNGEKPGSARVFGRNLTAAFPAVRPGSGSTKLYMGIEVRDTERQPAPNRKAGRRP